MDSIKEEANIDPHGLEYYLRNRQKNHSVPEMGNFVEMNVCSIKLESPELTSEETPFNVKCEKEEVSIQSPVVKFEIQEDLLNVNTIKEEQITDTIGKEKYLTERFMQQHIEKDVGDPETSLLKDFTKQSGMVFSHESYIGLSDKDDFNVDATKEDDLKCKCCGKRFPELEVFIKHRCSDSSKSLMCHICDQRFTRPYTLRKHFFIHSGDVPFKCDLCRKRFKDKCLLSSHLLTHTDNKLFSCDICKNDFRTRHQLKIHMSIHIDQKPFKCDICGKSFKLRHHLINHALRHSGLKPYKCEFCDKTFARQQYAKQHTYIHTGEKPYRCLVCNENFTRLDQLRYHSLGHALSEQLKCNICNKTFARAQHLRQHTSIHTGYKPFTCDICNKSFVRRDHLNLHISTHTGAKPFECSICGKSFGRHDHLKKHITLHTKNGNIVTHHNKNLF